MAFAAVLTALGYYIILRRFCQGLLKIFLQGAATGEEVFPLCRLPTPAFGVLPCPSPPRRRGRLRQVEPATKTATPQPGAANARRASEAGQAPPPARDTPPAPVPPGFSPGDARGAAPCIRKLKISPFPAGEGGRGDGGKKEGKGRGQQAVKKASPHRAPQRQG